MRSIILSLILTMITFFATAQIKDIGISPDLIVEQPTWIENPIGSIIGLVLLLGMFAYVGKVALSKE